MSLADRVAKWNAVGSCSKRTSIELRHGHDLVRKFLPPNYKVTNENSGQFLDNTWTIFSVKPHYMDKMLLIF